MAHPFKSHSHFIFFFSCFFFTASTLLSNETDFHALLAFKAAINQDPLNTLTSWNETSRYCTWKGISCSKKHRDRVVGINLMSRGLIGSLTPYIGNLSFLKSINLRNNTFIGLIPEEIGLLRRLVFIEFSNNSFTLIPKNLSQCSDLNYLNLIDNKLSGELPRELGSLIKLEALGLAKNSLSGPIPSFIGNLTSLRILSMTSCNLIGEISETLSQLKSLSFIQFGENNLTGTIPLGLFNISSITFFGFALNQLHGAIPTSIGLTIPNLQELELTYNQFTGKVPRSFANASSLEVLDLSYNNFEGNIPKEIGRLSHLSWFGISENQIQDDIKFISLFTNCTNLQHLGVGLNQLRGSLPQSIANLSRTLNDLLIYNTEIEGSIPFGIENLVDLARLDLSHNNLDGAIPSSIGNLINLQRIDLQGNKFANKIPSSLGKLSLLSKMYLNNNFFLGSMPRELGNCTSLLLLDLSQNNLNGTIPQDIMKLSSITILFNASNNALSGSIPAEVRFLTNLIELDLSHNRLSGVIPNSLKNCRSLQRMNLEGNSFEGEIPTGLGVLKGLEELDLSQNNLTGKIPTVLTELHLKSLNLSFNYLQGEVPTKGVFANKSEVSLDGNSDLCGGISELKLPPCPTMKSERKHSSYLKKILIPVMIVGCVFLLVSSYFIWFAYRKRKSKIETTIPLFSGIEILRLSYKDLLKATNGFSQANLLGVGRFGSVYKGVIDGDDGQTVIAVKVFNLTVRGASKTFLAECNALKNIRHRNLLRIISACESIDFQGNDFKALVYEFQANGSLEKWLHRQDQEKETSAEQKEVRKLNIVQRLNVAIDVAHGIEYLHSCNDRTIVHGDLKPSNILLDDDMNACVGDFGLAKIISSTRIPSHQSNSSSSVAIKGTIGYVAPEYGMGDLVSAEGDIYGYGILLLELFTNIRPTDDLFHDHLNLHVFVTNALPDRVVEIVDPDIEIGHNMRDDDEAREFMASVLSIGVACSRENPKDRMLMTDVVRELTKIRQGFIVRRMKN